MTCFSDATAIGGESQNDGSDYIKLEGTLWFRHGETSKTIDLVINPNAHVSIYINFWKLLGMIRLRSKMVRFYRY